MGEVWVATHSLDRLQFTAARRAPAWFALLRAEDIRTTYTNTHQDLGGTAVIAKVNSPGLDGTGDTVILVSRSEAISEQTLPGLPTLFHLDLTDALYQARRRKEDEPLYVRAECEEGSWRWRVSTYDQLRERMEMQDLTAQER